MRFVISIQTLFLLQHHERVEDGFEPAPADPAVEVLGKGLQVNISGGHQGRKFPKRLLVDVAAGVHRVFNAELTGQLRSIVHVLVKDGGFGVSVGNGPAFIEERLPHHVLRAEIVIVRLFGPGLGYLPVLAEFAAQHASGGCDGKGGRSGQDVKEGFFLNRVDCDGAGLPVDQAVEACRPC